MQTITAKFDSKCAACGVALKRGDSIGYDRTERKAYCAKCASGSQVPADFINIDMLYEDQCAAACGL